MPRTYTENGNYAQNIEYRAICRAADEERAINRAAAAKKTKRAKSANPNSLPRGKWDVTRLRRAPPPPSGKRYPEKGSKR